MGTTLQMLNIPFHCHLQTFSQHNEVGSVRDEVSDGHNWCTCQSHDSHMTVTCNIEHFVSASWIENHQLGVRNKEETFQDLV